jgi:dienelactone hydrolase
VSEPSTTVRLRERQTVRTARYAVVGAEPSQARCIWVALHGYGMLASRFARAFEGAVPADTCVVAPEALSRFYIEMPRPDGGHLQKVGATWLTRESRDTEIADAHAWLDLVHDDVVRESTEGRGEAPRVAVLAFSQGVATAMRWIAHGRVAPQQFVAWAGGVAQDVDREAFRSRMHDVEMLLVAGDSDPFATPTNRTGIMAALATMDVPHQSLSFSGAHHLDTPLLSTLLRDFSERS